MSDPCAVLPSVSIALCTFNGERYIEQQLKSLAKQSVQPIEVVVGDDGSSDRTLELLQAFAAGTPFPVRVTRNARRLGYRENFVRTAGRCGGELILFCDQDDVWFPEKIRTTATAFTSPDVLLVYHDAEVADEAGRPLGRLYRAPEEQRVLAISPMPPQHSSYGFTQAFRRQLLGFDELWPESRDHFSEHPMAHDQWYLFLALALGEVKFIEEPLARYRQHGANAFGFVPQQSGITNVAHFLQHSPLSDRRRADAARRCASILDRVGGQAGQAARMATAAHAYRAAAERYERRASLFASTSLRRRFQAFRELLGEGGYAGRPWAFDWRSMPRDFLAGVLRVGGARD